MLSRRRLWKDEFVFLAILVVCAGVGCSGGPKLPPLARVTGRVTLDGKPVTTGIIVFVPDTDKGNDGPMAVGAMDRDGRYTLFTLKAEGAKVGWHKVRVEEPLGQGWAVPARYANTASSGLTAEVKADEDNVIDFKLSTKH